MLLFRLTAHRVLFFVALQVFEDESAVVKNAHTLFEVYWAWNKIHFFWGGKVLGAVQGLFCELNRRLYWDLAWQGAIVHGYVFFGLRDWKVDDHVRDVGLLCGLVGVMHWMEVEGAVDRLEAILGVRTHNEGFVGTYHSLGRWTVGLEGMLLGREGWSHFHVASSSNGLLCIE